jgi:hypothetical protein
VTDRARIERIRSSAGIARAALTQIREELGGPVDQVVLVEALRELFDEARPDAGVLGQLAQLLARASQTAVLTPIDSEDAESAACAIEEAAGFVTDFAGMRLYLATRTLHPQKENAHDLPVADAAGASGERPDRADRRQRRR